MVIHIGRSSKAAGILRIVCGMLLLCLLLSACGQAEGNNTGNNTAEPEAAPGAWDIAFSSGKAGLEEISLWPDDFTGFTIGFAPGNRDALFAAATPVRTDEYGVEYYEIPGILAGQLTGETARYCTPVSLGPDGSVLWKAPSLSGNGYALYIQRDRTLVAAAQSLSRGATDCSRGHWIRKSTCIRTCRTVRLSTPRTAGTCSLMIRTNGWARGCLLTCRICWIPGQGSFSSWPVIPVSTR